MAANPRWTQVLSGALLMCALAGSPAVSLAQSPAPPADSDDWIHAPDDVWINAADVQTQLAAGHVVTRTVLDEQRARASVEAAVLIHASPQSVWPLIAHCGSTVRLIPQIKHCRVLQTAADGSWSVIEHDIKYSLITPMVHSVLRDDLHPPYRMDFHRISGDFKYEVGSWILQPSADGSSTTAEYRLSVQPGFWIPRAVVRRSLRKDLPAALVALRLQAENAAAAPVAATSSPESPPASARSP